MLGLYSADKRIMQDLKDKQIPKAKPPLTIENLDEIEKDLGCHAMGSELPPVAIKTHPEPDYIL